MTSGKRLLLVDDDEFLRRSLGEQLRAQEDLDLVDEAASGAEALERAVDGHYDVILLDVGLPDQDGRDTCRAMRAAGVRAPIIILTAADTDDDTIQGLGAGANDYVTKPFRLGVLLARVRAQMRHHEQSDDAVFLIGPYRFQPATKMLVDRATERKVRLTEKETGILKFLYRAGDRVVARDVLLHEVWGYSAQVTTHTLETHIYRLRRKIEPDPGQATILVTEEGGYRLARSETAAG
jgi:DNA-binding response OmpR family regulator